MRFLLPVLLALLGLGLGIGGGYFFAGSADSEMASADDEQADSGDTPQDVYKYVPDRRRERAVETQFVDFTRQFIIPIILEDDVESLVIATMSAEIAVGAEEIFYAQEPRLRDAFLQVMFNHANTGGFEGPFTSSPRLAVLRRSLLEAGHEIMGEALVEVLFSELGRQDN